MTSPRGPFFDTLAAHARSRGPFVLGIALVALLIRVATSPAPPARSVEAIAAMLGASVGGSVQPEDFVWEERGGLVHDAMIGRRVLFIAARPSGPNATPTNDLYRAEVRISRGGRPISVRRVVNLTNTPLGHEHDLVAHGRWAAYATSADGLVQGITILDLAGDAASQAARTRSERLRASVENWLSEGALRGIGETAVLFGVPPKEARFELTEDMLVMALGEAALPAAVTLADASVNPGLRDEHVLAAQRLPHDVTPWSRFLEQTTRELVGEGAAGRVKRISTSARTIAIRLREATASPPPELPAAPPPETPSDEGFPPPRVATKRDRTLPGEGLWIPAPAAHPLPMSKPEAPPAIFTTLVRPDPDRPHAVVHLVAMDGRRLELRPMPGTLAPRTPTGLRGEGRIPAADVPAAVAVFAGGPPANTPPLGLVVERRTFLSPRPDASTLAVDRFGRPSIGAWPFGADVPVGIRSLRQTGAPLVTSGHIGKLSEADAVLADRSALCVTEAGHLIYGWGEALPAELLARALVLAGCRDALPLATSPDPTGIGFFQRTGDEIGARAHVAGMSLAPERALSGSPTELVYVVVRKANPDAPLPEGVAWEPDLGTQPAPLWQPGIYTATVSKLGAQVRLAWFAPERFTFHIRAGEKELSHRFGGTFPAALSDAERPHVLAATGLGTGRRKGPRGLAIDGSIGLKFGPGAGVLVVGDGPVRIDKSEAFTPTPDADATELPLTADEGRPLPEARVVGSMRPRTALCAFGDGAVLLASTTFDTDEATTEALVDAGCTRVVALDRGAHLNAFVHRAGGDTPPEARYEQTTLYALESPMRGRASTLIDSTKAN
ncbi:hypothetical protein [Polyangium jinanense]|uniref:Phosphodiester glycosidase domain-containing protein n=1 Tax=Polyangium jinanense TaxID=2829994 RepID=A0A9X3X6I0_9BACT|nr:hypothetical protein [Polyangium jinanense]MDC3982306.1 hypothetical protein [Polyangium jinanense]